MKLLELKFYIKPLFKYDKISYVIFILNKK